ncbi:hypothetical protein GGQ84_001873 [Desulfitispora alkaliphila]|uniref:hypothetical protein n=1 Tax=Desulfitispora alkaliphila TaxID=622674 RepID=UPI003D2568DA
MTISREVLYSVLEYPLVTYLTLIPSRVLVLNDISAYNSRPTVEVALNQQELRRIVAHRNVNIDELGEIDFSKSIVFVGLNFDIMDLKYRTIRVTAIGRTKTGRLEFHVVRRSYFYTDSFYIKIFNDLGKRMPIRNRLYQL